MNAPLPPSDGLTPEQTGDLARVLAGQAQNRRLSAQHLEQLAGQLPDRQMARVVNRLATHLRHGESLASAVRRCGAPPSLIGTAELAEEFGHADLLLADYVQQLQAERELRIPATFALQRVAMQLLLFAAFAGTAAMLVPIVGRYSEVIVDGFGIEISPLTRVWMVFVQAGWIWGVIGAIAILMAVLLFAAGAVWRRYGERVVLFVRWLPGLGPALLRHVSSSLLDRLAVLVQHGVPAPAALAAVGQQSPVAAWERTSLDLAQRVADARVELTEAEVTSLPETGRFLWLAQRVLQRSTSGAEAARALRTLALACRIDAEVRSNVLLVWFQSVVWWAQALAVGYCCGIALLPLQQLVRLLNDLS